VVTVALPVRLPTAVAKNKSYPSDLTDARWELIEPLVPTPQGGWRRAVHSQRRIVKCLLGAQIDV